ncbi:MAG TPA: hypothetical protein [Caudoviricetes sp.]|nr:MAG TPA: hypothetical protein [Caudoviricetes sp.]
MIVRWIDLIFIKNCLNLVDSNILMKVEKQ